MSSDESIEEREWAVGYEAAVREDALRWELLREEAVREAARSEEYRRQASRRRRAADPYRGRGISRALKRLLRWIVWGEV
jgi:hypothetical protein